MRIQIYGAGIWTRGVTCFDDFLALYRNSFEGLRDAEFKPPKPEAIPARERRRSGLLINLAVEVAHQACEQGNVDKKMVPSVFTSAMCDTVIADYMCRKLSTTEKLISPTKFHNSVHNAPSGYWSISAENRAPSTFVGGFLESFGAAFLEATSQAHASQKPVLLVAYDIENRPPFSDVTAIKESMGCAFIIAPDGSAETQEGGQNFDEHRTISVGATVDFQVGKQSDRRYLPCSPALAELARENPVGCALTLMEQLARIHEGEEPVRLLAFPAAPDADVEVELFV